MSLRDGTKKMSKSDPSDYSRINLTDDAETIAQKFRKAKTDPEPLPSEVAGLKTRPEADNLVGIYAALADTAARDGARASTAARSSPRSSRRSPTSRSRRSRRSPAEMRRLLADPGHIDRVLADGAQRARRHRREDPRRRQGRAGVRAGVGASSE